MKNHLLLRTALLGLTVILPACGSDTQSGGSTTPTGPSLESRSSSTCAAAVAGNPGAVPGSGGSYPLTIVTGAGCPWTAQSDVPWASVSPSSGSGTASPMLIVAENTDFNNTRSANLTVGGQILHLSQANGCIYVVDPGSADFSADSNRMGFRVSARDGCTWTASATESWIRITPSKGTGNDLIDVEVTTNTGGSRHATATIAGKRIAISQQGR
jgi:hypothetical protein